MNISEAYEIIRDVGPYHSRRWSLISKIIEQLGAIRHNEKYVIFDSHHESQFWDRFHEHALYLDKLSLKAQVRLANDFPPWYFSEALANTTMQRHDDVGRISKKAMRIHRSKIRSELHKRSLLNNLNRLTERARQQTKKVFV